MVSTETTDLKVYPMGRNGLQTGEKKRYKWDDLTFMGTYQPGLGKTSDDLWDDPPSRQLTYG